MKFTLLIFVLALYLNTFSQNAFEAVDRSAVEKAITDSTAATYYPKLLERFKSDDSTLTNEEFRFLYYGFVFQKEYSGYPELKQREINEALKKKNYDLAVRLCDSVLAKYPINLFGNFNKGLALFMSNKEDPLFKKYRNRYDRIMNAIISTGNGLKCETAFKTIFVNDEYFVIYNYFEIEKFKGQSLEGNCDRMRVEPSEYFREENIYFDTSESLLYMQRLFEKK